MSSQSSKYELQSPEWLNKEFFEKILRNCQQDDKIQVLELKIAPATLTNDHYGSVMFRSIVEYSDSKSKNTLKVSYIVKMAPQIESVKKDMLGDSFVFKTEIRMYTETIPKMEQVLRKYGDNTILGPKLIYSSTEPTDIIILEDLTELGFCSLDKQMPSYEQISRAMSTIAKWHAVSYKLANEQPETMTNYNDGNFNLNFEKIDFFASGIKTFIKNVLSADDELKTYIPYFEEVDKTFMKSCFEMGNAYKRGDKAIFVLNHGDFHCKNMMFKHNKAGKLEDLILVDFQMCYYGPVVLDLIYALYMLLDCETRWNKRDEVINEYFCHFQETLRKTEFKDEVPTMSELQRDFKKYQKLEIVLLAIFLPVSMAFCDDNMELDKIMESPEYRSKLYQHPRVVKEMKRALPRLLSKE